MRSKEAQPRPKPPELPAQVHVPLIGILPLMDRGQDGHIRMQTDFETFRRNLKGTPDIHEKIDKIRNAEWLARIKKEVKDGTKSGIFWPVAGGFIILIGAAGFEFGIRHGKDIKEFPKLLGILKRIKPK